MRPGHGASGRRKAGCFTLRPQSEDLKVNTVKRTAGQAPRSRSAGFASDTRAAQRAPKPVANAGRMAQGAGPLRGGRTELSGAFSSLWASSGPGCRCVVHASFLVSRWPAHREQRSSENKAPDPEGLSASSTCREARRSPAEQCHPCARQSRSAGRRRSFPIPPSPPVQTGRAPLPSRTNRTRALPSRTNRTRALPSRTNRTRAPPLPYKPDAHLPVRPVTKRTRISPRAPDETDETPFALPSCAGRAHRSAGCGPCSAGRPRPPPAESR